MERDTGLVRASVLWEEAVRVREPRGTVVRSAGTCQVPAVSGRGTGVVSKDDGTLPYMAESTKLLRSALRLAEMAALREGGRRLGPDRGWEGSGGAVAGRGGGEEVSCASGWGWRLSEPPSSGSWGSSVGRRAGICAREGWCASAAVVGWFANGCCCCCFMAATCFLAM